MLQFKRLKKFLLFYCLGMLLIPGVFCQTNTDSLHGELTASLNYQSRLHYFGRTDSLHSSGFFPIISYKTNIGLYATSTFIFIHHSGVPFQYTGTLLEGGYRFPDNKTISGNIYYDQFLYQPNSTLKQAAVKSQTGINTMFNSKIINIALNGDIKFSPSQIDYGITGGLDKLILFKTLIPGFVLGLDPSAYINSGTQNFTKSSNKTGVLGLPSNSTTSTDYKQLSILSYEFSLPIVLVKGKFNMYISPSFVSPQQLINADGTKDVSGQSSNLLYWAAGIGVKI